STQGGGKYFLKSSTSATCTDSLLIRITRRSGNFSSGLRLWHKLRNSAALIRQTDTLSFRSQLDNSRMPSFLTLKGSSVAPSSRVKRALVTALAVPDESSVTRS